MPFVLYHLKRTHTAICPRNQCRCQVLHSQRLEGLRWRNCDGFLSARDPRKATVDIFGLAFRGCLEEDDRASVPNVPKKPRGPSSLSPFQVIPKAFIITPKTPKRFSLCYLHNPSRLTWSLTLPLNPIVVLTLTLSLTALSGHAEYAVCVAPAPDPAEGRCGPPF